MKAHNTELYNHFHEILHQARKAKIIDNFLNESLRIELETLAQQAMNEEIFGFALDFYEVLGNTEKELEIANILVEQNQGDSMDAIRTFSRLKRRPELLNIIHLLENVHKSVDYYLGPVDSYFGEELRKQVGDDFKNWYQKLGFKETPMLGIHETANLAYHLAAEFDIGVGIAKGGLGLAYMFELFSMDVKIAEAHKSKKSENVSFKWVTKVQPNDFYKKNVVVFDNDVISGRTSRKVVQEIGRYNPSNISLCLFHPPIDKERSLGTIAKNIPTNFQHTYYPSDFNYKNINKVVERLEIRLQDKLNKQI